MMRISKSKWIVDVSLFIQVNNSIRDLCICYFYIELKEDLRPVSWNKEEWSGWILWEKRFVLWKEGCQEFLFCCKIQVSKINTTNNNTVLITTKKVVFDIMKRNLRCERRTIRIMKAYWENWCCNLFVDQWWYKSFYNRQRTVLQVESTLFTVITDFVQCYGNNIALMFGLKDVPFIKSLWRSR